MSKEVLYGIIGLLIGILITVFVFSTTGNNNYGMMRMMGFDLNTNSNPRQNTMMGNIDRHFIEQMIPHHEDAITMSKLALTKAEKPEVKQLAESIILSQGKEIDQMKRWYKKWFEQELPTGTQVMQQHGMMGGNGMHMGMMGNETDSTQLENAEDFDRAYVEDMIPHHQMAVMMANMLKNSTQRPEMKRLAQNIITSQTSEIDQMRQWLKEWDM